MTDSAHRFAMIMAGGAGTRLWPMSRQSRPKQLLPFIGGRSLLEHAVDRLEGTVPADQQLICTGERFRSSIKEAMPSFDDARILGEPEGRDTVNAVGFTAAVLEKQDPEAVFAVLTSDHLIQPLDEFRRKLSTGFALVEADPSRFVTFGIKPTWPADCYGYVERGSSIDGHDASFNCERFVEKPERSVAEEYLAKGTFDWNSGMFIFQAKQFMQALEWFQPESHWGLKQIAEAWGTAKQQNVLDAIYPTLPKTSVDYGVMEPASADERIKICAVSMDLQWIDVGSWPSYGDTLDADGDGCRSNTTAHHIGSKNILAVSDDPNHAITTIGCDDLIIVHTDDATLVCRNDEAQRVKEMAGIVDAELR